MGGRTSKRWEVERVKGQSWMLKGKKGGRSKLSEGNRNAIMGGRKNSVGFLDGKKGG
jgi:hypothetical protein